ncbi:DUF7344 domain-containing protein [Halostella salina]|uniref:DUF7344 domain-containing protein n=1 Tax=Halostella salina TaxID=1547897 RepID=UPI000EF80191|nr:hypothetical protein [Halostella salina]
MDEDWTPGDGRTVADDDHVTPGAIDTAFDLLSVERRRHALYCLRGRDGSVSVSDLADAVIDRGSTSPADPERHRERVVISLGQVHLPKLADADVVDYDRADSSVSYVGDPVVDRFLTRAAELER